MEDVEGECEGKDGVEENDHKIASGSAVPITKFIAQSYHYNMEV